MPSSDDPVVVEGESEVPPRQHRDPERTSAAILAAATREFADKGYGGARIAEITRRAGTNKRMIYHYFGSKEGLYIAVFEAAYAGIRIAESHLDLDDVDPVAGVRELCLFTWNYFIRHPEFLELLHAENQAKAQHIKQSRYITRLHEPLVDMIESLVRRGVAAGEFQRQPDAVEMYITIASIGYFYMANHWTLSAIFARELTDREALRAWGQHVVDVVLAWLRTPEEDSAG